MSNLMLTSALLLASLLVPGTLAAQTTAAITITPTNSQKVISGAPDRFTGSVRVQSLFDAKEPSRSSGELVTFQPGARSAWHTHPLGQVLVVTDGEGWIQQMGRTRSGDSKGRRHLDSSRREALAWSHTDHHDDAHRFSGTA